MIADSTGSTVNPATKSGIEVVTIEAIPNSDPISSGLLTPRSTQQSVQPAAVQARNVSQSIFKIIQTGEISVEKTGAGLLAETEIEHGLNFAPIVIGFLISAPALGIAGPTPLPFVYVSGSTNPGVLDVSGVVKIAAYTDVLVLTVQVGGSFYNGTYTASYYLLEQTSEVT